MDWKEWIEMYLFNSKNYLNSRRVKHNNRSWIRDKFPDVYEQILNETQFLDADVSLKQRLYHLYNNVRHRVYCNYCRNTEVSFISFSKGYSKYCSMECTGKSENVKNNRNKTMKSVDWEERNKKSKETKRRKYGNENFNNIENAKPGNKYHDYQLPSGKWIRLQGYEPKAIDELLRIYSEDEILYKASEMPDIWYYKDDNSKHKYYPDFFIPKDNLIIEVKSEYTYNYALEINKLKEEATKNLGYNFEFRIYK